MIPPCSGRIPAAPISASACRRLGFMAAISAAMNPPKPGPISVTRRKSSRSSSRFSRIARSRGSRAQTGRSDWLYPGRSGAITVNRRASAS